MAHEHSTLVPLSPLRLAASLHQTIWGGQNLASVVGKSLPADVRVGETWETEIANVVLDGPYAGMTLGQVVAALDERLLGTRAVAVFGHRFPLLTKFMDAQDTLSVQVHPNDEQARQQGRAPLGKTEAWYILRSTPGARLVLGFESDVSVSQVRQAIADDRLEALLHTVEVHAGDVVFVPAGTVHAIGAGVVLYEVQEYSDITYRLYDFGRVQSDGTRRELHIEQALQVLDLSGGPRAASRPVEMASQSLGESATMRRRVLVACRYFVLEELQVAGTVMLATHPTSCEIISLLEGTCALRTGAGADLHLRRGETVVLPAQLGRYALGVTGYAPNATSASARLLRSYVPTDADDALSAWRHGQG